MKNKKRQEAKAGGEKRENKKRKKKEMEKSETLTNEKNGSGTCSVLTLHYSGNFDSPSLWQA